MKTRRPSQGAGVSRQGERGASAIGPAVLSVRLKGGLLPFLPGQRAINHVTGGPDVLLRWLETRLGLLSEPIPFTSRVAEYREALAKVQGASFRRSFDTDPWATAAELLSRRHELRLAGWEERDSPDLPPLVRDLARVAATSTMAFADEAERLRRVLAAMDGGQRLPWHRVILHDPIDAWPCLWQTVLRRLATESASEVSPGARGGTVLGCVQKNLAGEPGSCASSDTTVRWFVSRSVHAACETVAAGLIHAGDLGEVTVYCEDPAVAVCLDGCLRHRGLPTMGVRLSSLAHPALQVLPMVLSLLWEPVDPSQLMDFLNLPLCPLPRRAAVKLARALSDQPGLGSREWERAVRELCSPEQDPKGELARRLDLWLGGSRCARGSEPPTSVVAGKCRQVAQWAAGLAATLDTSAGPSSADLARALELAASLASTLGGLVETIGGSLTEPQLQRMYDEVVAEGAGIQPYAEAAGGPVWVTSLADVPGPCRVLIWLGLGTEDPPSSRWTTQERRLLAQAGIHLDDGRGVLASVRRAELRGLCCVTESLMALSLPGDEERRTHPLWVRIQGLVKDEPKSLPLEAEVQSPSGALSPLQVDRTTVTIARPQPPRPLWHIPQLLLQDHNRSSATELENRLACPMKWVFERSARIRPSPMAAIPEDFTLKGSFCHWVMQEVFSDPNLPLDPDQVAQRALACFDRRLALDAAPLSQARCASDRQRLRSQLAGATRVLVDTLRLGGYRVAGMEVSWTATLNGRDLNGRIDCLAARPDGQEAVIDFKYGGRDRYRDLLVEGRAVQLATYAFGRSQTAGGPGSFPRVAYLVLANGLLYTPSGSPIQGQTGASVVDGPAIDRVWSDFVEALDQSEGWLTKGEAIPARPLQEPAQWPAGTLLVLKGPDAKGKMPEEQDVCRYCDYEFLCGLSSLE